MFLYKQGRRHRGFTLIELAIVMGVVGVMSAGVWRLMATGNQQTKDQAAAQQQQVVIQAVQGFLTDTQGVTLLTEMNAGLAIKLPLACGAAAIALTFPAQTDAAHAGNYSNTALCNYLPPGWNNINAYGQTYSVQILKDASSVNVAPLTYSFMVIASSAAVTIPDADGGRISSLIGGDGGFIYSTPVCTAAVSAKAACGTMGAWQDLDITAATGADYKFPAAANVKVGSIVSRTAVLPMTSSNNWLSRTVMPNDVATTPTYNTMTTNLFVGGNKLQLGTDSTLQTGGGNVYLQGGTVFAQGSATATALDLGNFGRIVGGSGGSFGAQIALTEDTSIASNGNSPALKIIDTNAASALCVSLLEPCTSNIVSVTGNVKVIGQLQASNLFATNMLYSSDRRLKKDITPLTHALDGIMQINPVSFTFKSSGVKTLGVIAQNVKEVYPQLVAQDSKGYFAVAYSGLIAPLIGSVQELKKENDELRAMIQAQEERQNKMQQELDALKQQQ